MTPDNVLPQSRSLVRFLTIAIVITSCVLAWLAWDAYALHRAHQWAIERNIRVEKLAGSVTYLDEVLTMSARMGASTGVLKWEDRYRSYEPQLDAVIKEMITLAPVISEAIKKTDVANIKLVEMEHRGFDLVREGHLEEAKFVVMGDAYEAQKKIYANGLSEFKNLFQNINVEIRRKEYHRELLHIAFILLSIFVLMIGWVVLLKVMKMWEAAVFEKNQQLTLRTNELAKQTNQLSEKTRELSELNTTLDQKVSERTKELEFSHLAALNMNEDMVREIEERKRAEQEVKKAQGHLIEAEKSAMVAQLAAGAAHEVKNPLAIILQGVDYLSHHIPAAGSDSSMPSVLKDMQDAVARADYTIKGLLDLARPEKLTVAPEDLNAIIESSFFLVKNYLDHRKAQTVKNYGEKLPHISADKGKIIQVFINLLSNAADAMPSGGIITIKTYAKKLTQAGGQVGRRKEDIFSVGQQVVVAEIEDTGEGIKPEILSKIFDPFFTTKRGKGGTGLGLSVVRNIVEIHHGTISLQNKEAGSGVRAVVVFPAETVPR